MRYVCCQPASMYYSWQLETMINNFLKMGVPANKIDIVCAYDGVVSEMYRKLQSYPVNFYFYEDLRTDKSYPPSTYFFLMKEYLKEHPYSEPLFLHDCDILFTRPVNFMDMAQGDEWYLSDTNSYINYDYVVSKGEAQFLEMCKIVGINPEVVRENNLHSGGAQYIVKNVTSEFFAKVEDDSNKIYSYLCKQEPSWVKKHEADYPIQKWTAGMWAFLWNAWLFNHKTIVDPRMSFGWVTNLMSDVVNHPILHNAGVVNSNMRLMYKQDFALRLPYGVELDIDPSKAGYWYWLRVQETGKNSVL